jgi:mono/diheme cytochrome c family protein
MSDRLSPSRNRVPPKRRKFIVPVLVGGVAAIGLAATVSLNWPTASMTGADPDDPTQVAMGRAVYQQNCASCHGVRLEGQPNWRIRKPDGKLPAPPHDESGHTWHHPDPQLFKITGSGVAALVPGYESDMPAYEGVLSDQEIWAVLAFIKSTWSPEIRRRQDRRSQGAKQ